MDALQPFMRYGNSLPTQRGHGMPLKGDDFHEEDSPREHRLVKKEGGTGVGDWHEGEPHQDHAKEGGEGALRLSCHT